MGRKWRIAKTLKKTVWIAIRPENRGFYVLEEYPDPTSLGSGELSGAASEH